MVHAREWRTPASSAEKHAISLSRAQPQKKNDQAANNTRLTIHIQPHFERLHVSTHHRFSKKTTVITSDTTAIFPSSKKWRPT
jgi:hypothetical protein